MSPKPDPNAHISASELLKRIYDLPPRETISIGEFITLLGDRSFALVILIFSLPNSLPVPGIPGFSTITGLPILFIAFQMLMGRDSIWLPKKIAAKNFSYNFLRKIIKKALPVIVYIEKFLHPRMLGICNNNGERVIGLFIAMMAFILTLPIVGGNFLPGAAISLMALALLENDGLFACFSIAFCILSLYIMLSILMWVAQLVISWVLALL